jgi:cobalt/nickel transport system ATP-binding protein
VSVFELEGVCYSYGSQVAIDGISLSIEAGRRVALLGANGSGKSTLLRLLDALYFPDSGSVSFHGHRLEPECFEDDRFAFDFRRRVGLVFQNPDVQLFNPTVFDEVAFAPLQLRWPKAKIVERVTEMLELMEIAGLKDRAPHRLSGGEKKRVALASVLVLDPEVLLLDEPTSALDPEMINEVLDVMVELAQEGMTMMCVTHEMGFARKVAHRVIFMDKGIIVEDDKKEDFFANPKSDRAKDFLAKILH